MKVPKVGYTVEFEPEKTAKAMAREVRISPKHAYEVAKTIKGMKLEEARKLLEDVVDKKVPIPMKRYKRDVGHRKGMGPGRFPVKCASEFLKLLKNAESNAKYKGLNPEKMRIIHVCAKEGRTIYGIFPRARGRATPKRRESVHIEVIIGEV